MDADRYLYYCGCHVIPGGYSFGCPGAGTIERQTATFCIAINLFTKFNQLM